MVTTTGNGGEGPWNLPDAVRGVSVIRSTLRRLGKDSIVYGLGGAASGGIGLLLLPIYTRIFAPSAFGAIAMLVVICSFLGAVLSMGMDGAQSFYFFEQKKAGQRAQARVVSAIVQWRLVWGSVVVAVALAMSPWLNAAFFHGRLPWKCFAAAFAGMFFGKLASQSADVFRLLYRPWPYLGVNVCRTLTAASVTIVLVTILDFGIFGFFLGSAIGSAAGALLGWYGIRAYVDWSRWHGSLWPRLVRFGAPLVPGSVAMYILMTADRWFVNYHHGEDAVGIYAVGVMFALGFGMIVNAFRQAWWPMAMDYLHRPEGAAVFRTIGRLYLGFGSAAVVLLAGVSPWLIQLFTARPFHSAYPIVGTLAWQSLFYGFHMIAVAGLWKNASTARVTISMGVAAVLNVVLDAWLVPNYGSIGAAVATSFSFLVWNILVMWMSEKQWPVHYPYAVFGAQIAVGVLATACVLVLYDRGQPGWTVVLIVVAAIFTEIRLTAGGWIVAELRGHRNVELAQS